MKFYEKLSFLNQFEKVDALIMVGVEGIPFRITMAHSVVANYVFLF